LARLSGPGGVLKRHAADTLRAVYINRLHTVSVLFLNMSSEVSKPRRNSGSKSQE